VKPEFITNGRPVAPQVRQLHERFGVVKRGDKILNEDIAKVIGEPWNSTRYKTVVGSWRKEVFDNTGIWLVAMPRVGYEAPTDSLQVGNAARGHRSSIRKFVRETRKAEVVVPDKLTEVERRGRDFLLTTGRLIVESVRPSNRSAMALLAPSKTDTMPQRG